MELGGERRRSGLVINPGYGVQSERRESALFIRVWRGEDMNSDPSLNGAI